MRKIMALLAIVFFLSKAGAWASVIDAPHNSTNGIMCSSCHTYSLWWQYSPAEQSISPGYGAITDALCNSCHDGSNPLIPNKLGHNHVAMGAMHRAALGNWSTQCIDCHDPHYQRQLEWSGVSLPYLLTGVIGTVTADANSNTTELTYGNVPSNNGSGDWTDRSRWARKNNNPDFDRGLILVADIAASSNNTYQIIEASETTIVVRGKVAPEMVGKGFGLLYGQLIRKAIETEKGMRSVKFFNPDALHALGGFTDTETPRQGVCQVCHVNTLNWKNDGTGEGHYADLSCSACHDRALGFKPSVDHSERVQGVSECLECHPGTAGTAAGISINANDNKVHDSCRTCHAVDWSLMTVTVADNPSTVATVSAMVPGTCLSCHGNYFDSHGYGSAHLNTALRGTDLSNSKSCNQCHGVDGADSGTIALDVWSEISALHTSCATCHSSTRNEVKNSIISGMEGSQIGCLTCHGDRTDHIAEHNDVGYEDTPSLELIEQQGTCATCHDGMGFTNLATGHVGRVIGNAELNGAGYNGLTIGCATCHQSQNSTVINQIALGKGGELISCADCHGPRASGHIGHPDTDFAYAGNCASCHSGSVTTSVHGGLCFTCHNADYTRKDGSGTGNGNDGDARLATNRTATCLTCHPNAASKNGASVIHHDSKNNYTASGNCTQCHGTSFPVDHASVWVKGEIGCSSCHDGTTGNYDARDAIVSPFVSSGEVHFSKGCVSCHSTVDGSLLAGYGKAPDMVSGGGTCSSCHGNYFDSHGYGSAHLNTALRGTDLSNSKSCNQCHGVDGADSGTIALDVWSEISALHTSCATCHSSTRNEVKNSIISGMEGSQIGCLTCHGDKAEEHTPDHGAGGLSYVTDTPLCVNCHQHTANDSMGVHNNNCAYCHTSTIPAVLASVNDRNHVTSIAIGQCTSCHGGYFPQHTHDHSQQVKKNTQATPVTKNCIGCHSATTSPFASRGDVHGRNGCATCHDLQSNGGLIAPAVAGGGECRICHTTYFGSHSHVHTINQRSGIDLSAGSSCNACHGKFVNNWSGILGLHNNNCSTCHDATRNISKSGAPGAGSTTIQDVITFGAEPTGCLNCHYDKSAAHMPDHTNAGYIVSTPSCVTTGCHDDADYVTETHKNNCAHCHATPSAGDYQLIWYAAGHRVPENGSANECITCHDYGPSFYIHHDAGVKAKRGDCQLCHKDPRPAVGAPAAKQLSCRECHMKYDFPSRTLTVMSINVAEQGTAQATGTQAGNIQTPVPGHTFSGSNGVISNYGACFECHGATGRAGYEDAPRMMPYHALRDTVTIGGVDGLNGAPDPLPGEQFRTGFTGELYKIGVGNSRPTRYIGIDSYYGPGRGIFNIGFAPHSLPMRWLKGSVFQRNLNRMWVPWMKPATTEPYTFFEINPQLSGQKFFVPKFEEVNFGSAQGVDTVAFSEAPVWRNRILTVKASSTSGGTAKMTVVYGGVGYQMTSKGGGLYEFTKDFNSYPKYAYNSQVIGGVWVVSSLGGNANYSAPTYTTPTGDDIAITSARWNKNTPGGELTVSAVNTASAAVLTVHYNGSTYAMSETTPNNYSATIGNATFVPTITVTSSAGGSMFAPVANVGADVIAVLTAEWVQNNTGRQLTVRASNTVIGAELWVVYNGVHYQMAEDSSNHYSRAIEDTAYQATLNVYSTAAGGGQVNGVAVRRLFENEDHVRIVPGVKDSPYIDTLNCFTNYCHSGNTYDEHLTPGGIAFQAYQDRGTPFQCTQCHVDAPGNLTGADPAIENAIHAGAVLGQNVYCSDCHKYDSSRNEAKYRDPNYSIARQHHTNVWEAKDGDCTICHIDPRIDPYGTGVSLPQPKMLPCIKCHIDSKPTGGAAGKGQVTVYKSRTLSQIDPYNGNVNWQWQFSGPIANTKPVTLDGVAHQWNVEGGMIKNFGVCLFCHKMRPYHAKPPSKPVDTNKNSIDMVNDPPHFAGPGRGTLGVFYASNRMPFKYYQQTGQQVSKNIYRAIRDKDAVPMGGLTWWANVTYDPQDPNRYIPPDHNMGGAEYFSIPTFDPPTGNDTVAIGTARFSDQQMTLQVTATSTNRTEGYLLYAIHHGKSYPMVQGPVGTWNYTFNDFTVPIGDNPGRVYVISVNPNNHNELQAQAFRDISQTSSDVLSVSRADWNGLTKKLTVNATNTANGATLTVHYGNNVYQMAQQTTNSYTLSANGEAYFSTGFVTSSVGGETFMNILDVTPPTDQISIMRAEWNGANTGAELRVEATNTTAGATLTVHYDGNDYPMTLSGANTWTLTGNNPAHASQLTVSSSKGGSKTATVVNLTPQDVDHPHVVPGIRNSPYLETLTCFASGCHAGNTYDEHMTPTGIAYQRYQSAGKPFECAMCHQYSDSNGRPVAGTTFNDDPVINAAIAMGVNSGQDVYCSDCHSPSAHRLDPQGLGWSAKYADPNYSIAGQHHEKAPQTKAGDCVACHKDPRKNPYGTGVALPQPKQLPCKNCHAQINPVGGSHGTGQFTIYKTRTGNQINPYGGNVTWLWQFTGPIANTNTVTQTGIRHQWNVDGGNITNYGVCLFCHKMRPYHARPAFPPQDPNMSTLDQVNDPPHYAGPGRATLGVFYPFFRKPFKYYFNAPQRQNGHKEVYKNIRDSDAIPLNGISWWSNVVYDPQTDPTGMVPADHTMGAPEYFTIPTFDPPLGGDTVTITSASFSDTKKELTVSATNTADNVQLYLIHGGKSYAMTQGALHQWTVKASGYPQQVGDSAGRVYVISVNPIGNDVLLDQKIRDL